MKSSLIQFFSSNQVIALFSSIFIFMVTIFLVAKRWIGFSITFILLLFALLAGILINNPQFFSDYSHQNQTISLTQQEDFKKQILQAIDDVKQGVQTEKENFQHLKNQVQEIYIQVDTQKQKLDHFIDETRHRFQDEKPRTAEKTRAVTEPGSDLKTDIPPRVKA